TAAVLYILKLTKNKIKWLKLLWNTAIDGFYRYSYYTKNRLNALGCLASTAQGVSRWGGVVERLLVPFSYFSNARLAHAGFDTDILM
ncbi:MAG: hypothetical protein COV79_02235, partial [Parcubacteria group bacterium CG11_big_fil_rev_8_21_14_0_20_41_14]